MEILAPGIVVFNDVIQNPLEIINDFEKAVSDGILSFEDGYVAKNDKSVPDYEFRKVFLFWIKYEKKNDQENNSLEERGAVLIDKMRLAFNNSFKNSIEQYQQLYNWQSQEFYDYQFLRYQEGHFVKTHTDNNHVEIRNISLCYYFNDDYEGGELYFPNIDLIIKPKKNQLVLFPSNFVYSHEVKPVTSGTRYAVTQWIR